MENEEEKKIKQLLDEMPCLDHVDGQDRAACRALMYRLVTFDKIMPKLSFSFAPQNGHYNMDVWGWCSPFDMELFNKMFLDRSRHMDVDIIQRAFCTPSPDATPGPRLTFKIDRTYVKRSSAMKSKNRRGPKKKHRRKKRKFKLG